MVTKEQVLDALQHLIDPAVGRSLVEMGLVKDVMIKETRINLTLVLTEDREEIRARLRLEAEAALKSFEGAEAHIRFRQITETEYSDLNKRLQGNAAESAPPKPAQQPSSVLDPQSGVKFIAVASGKGGVGKSTVTVNLAVALARQGKKVAIIDADIYGFSVPDMMGIEDRPQMKDERIIPVERFGVKVMSMGFFVEDNAPIIWRGPMLGKMLRNFFNEVDWGQLDYMVLDLPPGTGDVALDVHQLIPQSKEIIVTTPHATAAFVAARAGSMALHTQHDILGIVENMSYFVEKSGEKAYVFGRGGGAKLAEELQSELLAQIPLGAPDNLPGEPDFSPSVYGADTETGRLYSEVAQRIIGKLE